MQPGDPTSSFLWNILGAHVGWWCISSAKTRILRAVASLLDRRTRAGDLFPSLLCNILGVHVDCWRIPSATTGNYVLSWVCLTGGHDESVNSLAFLRMFVTVIPEISCWLTGGHDFYCLLVPHDVPSVWRRDFVCPFVSARPNSNCGFRELTWVI